MPEIVYSDLTSSLKIEVSGEVALDYNYDAIVASIKTILSTKQGERLMNPLFGSNLKTLLFEPMDEITSDLIESEISSSIERWEDRVFLRRLTIYPNYDKNVYILSMDFVIKEINQNATYETAIKAYV